MTDLLEKAFSKASELEDSAQDEFARFLLAELKAEKRWDALLSDSLSTLERLAEEATADYRADKTESGGFGKS